MRKLKIMKCPRCGKPNKSPWVECNKCISEVYPET